MDYKKTNYNSPEKILVERIVMRETNYKGSIYLTEEMIAALKPGDRINAGYQEGHDGGNDAWDPYFLFEILRYELETDEEFNERQMKLQEDRQRRKEQRRKEYLKLKEEFENDADKK